MYVVCADGAETAFAPARTSAASAATPTPNVRRAQPRDNLATIFDLREL